MQIYAAELGASDGPTACMPSPDKVTLKKSQQSQWRNKKHSEKCAADTHTHALTEAQTKARMFNPLSAKNENTDLQSKKAVYPDFKQLLPFGFALFVYLFV